MRLDQHLVQAGLISTRARAQDAIAQGRVKVNDITIQKNSYNIKADDHIVVMEEEVALASRAGFKLLDVLEDFGVSLHGRICIDVGASTGGFSDVCLKQGASLVYAVDVGRDQLLPRLKSDPRIINMEGVNCRYLKEEMFQPLPNFACMDVSFISIKQILPSVMALLQEKEAVVLIKPQFEAGRAYLNKHGVVKDARVHVKVLADMLEFVTSMGYYVHHLQASSLKGRDGNKEFVMHIKEERRLISFPLKQIVEDDHAKR